MGIPTLTNATLTTVASAGFSPDYDEAATAGTTKWSGNQPVFYSQQTAQITASTTDSAGHRPIRRGVEHIVSDTFVIRHLVIDADAPITFAIDDVVTIVHNGDTATGIVQNIATSRATSFGVTRLVLADA